MALGPPHGRACNSVITLLEASFTLASVIPVEHSRRPRLSPWRLSLVVREAQLLRHSTVPLKSLVLLYHFRENEQTELNDRRPRWIQSACHAPEAWYIAYSKLETRRSKSRKPPSVKGENPEFHRIRYHTAGQVHLGEPEVGFAAG